MGYELHAPVKSGKEVSLAKIADELCSKNNYVLEGAGPKMLNLRLSSKERRSDWPEYFSLFQHDDGGLLLTIHNSNWNEIKKIVGDIELALECQQVSVCFQEN